MIIEAKAPTRVDLAGGTLDIWPLYLFHPGAVTVNAAISRYAYANWKRVRAGTSELTWFRGIRNATNLLRPLPRWREVRDTNCRCWRR